MEGVYPGHDSEQAREMASQPVGKRADPFFPRALALFSEAVRGEQEQEQDKE
jgi:hypothetical protein